MADELKSITEYPDISFIDGWTVEKLEEAMLQWYREKKEELTGQAVTLAKGDDRRLILLAGAYYIFQGYMMVDDAGKMGLLKYARGDYLENLGALKRVSRKPAAKANTTLRFHIGAPREAVTAIPEGTRATAGNNVYFATDSYAEIPAGAEYADVGATCTEAGEAGNHFDKGDLSTLVDPVPFIQAVENVTVPENGTDIESDDALRLRIYLAPSSYSSAGTEDAYRYFALSFNPNISDVLVLSPEPRIVKIVYLLENGKIPGPESIEGLQEYMSQPDIRMLTDVLEVEAPTVHEYDIKLTYYINQSDKDSASVIQTKVNAAVQDYVLWQSAKISRDINPDALIERIRKAGAKRVEIVSPVYTKIEETEVASVGTQTVTYGGLEDD